MDYGKYAHWALLLTLTACAEPPAADDERFAEQPAVQSWLNGVQAAAPADKPATKQAVPPVRDMIVGLEQKLAENPDDRKGWVLLAQSYAFVGNMPHARTAADRAIELGADADALAAIVDDDVHASVR